MGSLCSTQHELFHTGVPPPLLRSRSGLILTSPSSRSSETNFACRHILTIQNKPGCEIAQQSNCMRSSLTCRSGSKFDHNQLQSRQAYLTANVLLYCPRHVGAAVFTAARQVSEEAFALLHRLPKPSVSFLIISDLPLGSPWSSPLIMPLFVNLMECPRLQVFARMHRRLARQQGRLLCTAGSHKYGQKDDLVL